MEAKVCGENNASAIWHLLAHKCIVYTSMSTDPLSFQVWWGMLQRIMLQQMNATMNSFYQ
jgi:hypothetical protein